MFQERPGLPTGTVTFLFSDIEGSTRLLQQLGDAYGGLLERHGEIIRKAVAASRGYEVSTEGDGFFGVFALAGDAVECAVAVQRALHDEPWPGDVEVRVRMGVHTGEGRLRPDGYVGIDVHRAARIGGCGHGGQILLSAATKELVERDLPAGARLVDLGRHELKDLAFPEHLFQLDVSGLPGEFPPIRTSGITGVNLPVRDTAFIGRETEAGSVTAAVERHRLVTLVGAAGVGKTSLAVHAGARVAAHFAEGVYFVEISRLGDRDEIAPAVARELRISQSSAEPPARALGSRLGYASVLIILDGCEHLIADVAVFADELLQAAPGVHLLVTSREPLALRSEYLVRLGPLPTPGPLESDPAEITATPAVALLVDRVRMVRPGFEITVENARGAAEIVRRLDGIPLAIELVAAQLKLLSVAQIVERLTGGVTDMRSSRRDAMPHHQTLGATLDWSYESLTPEEQLLFLRLAVFSGSFTLEAVEQVCCADQLEPGSVLSPLARLVDTSLVLVTEGDPVRYRLLEPIAQYARSRLPERDDPAAVYRRHADYYMSIAAHADRELLGKDQLHWLRLLDEERYNLVAALGWMNTAGDLDGVVRMAVALRMRWMIRREVGEGARWLGVAVDHRAQIDPRLAVHALNGAALLAVRRLELEEAEAWLREAHDLARQYGGATEAAQLAALAILAWFRDDDDTRADELAAKAATLGPDWWTSVWIRATRGTLARVRGDHEVAAGFFDEAHRMLLARGGAFDLGWSHLRMGALAKDLGQYARATRHLQEGRVLLTQADDRIGLAHADAGLGALAWLRGDHEQALALYESVLSGFGRAEEVADNLFELRTMLQGRVSAEQLAQIARWNQERAALGERGSRAALAEHLFHLGKTAFRRGELDRARAALVESLVLSIDAEDQRGRAIALIALGRVFLEAGDPERAVILLACAAAVARSDALDPWPPADEPLFERHVDDARHRLLSGTFERAWDRGSLMHPADARAMAAVRVTSS